MKEEKENIVCPNCGNVIDPTVCWCGSPIPHTYYDGHSAVPMGCTCSYKKENNKEENNKEEKKV